MPSIYPKKSISVYRDEDNVISGVEHCRGKVRVDLVNLYEGWCGDYDPDDPEDENLLRFDVYTRENGEWIEVNDSSYCTQVPANVSDEVAISVVKTIMGEVYDSVNAGHPIKKLCERLSWIDADLNL